jgi:hypothetical protein
MRFIFTLLLAVTFTSQVQASTAAVTAPVAEQKKDLDTQVTDIKLRVDSGKKRKLSSSVSFIYKAGTWENPNSASRPPIGDQTRAEDQSVSGSLTMRYRKSINESFILAAGFYQQKPFHDLTSDEKVRGEDRDVEIFSPQVGYNNTFGVKSWEFSSSVRAYYNTLEYKKQIGEVWAVGYTLAALRRVTGTRLRLGLSGNVFYTDFNKDEGVLRGRTTDLRPNQIDYAVNLTPSAQYDFTDKLNLYTSLKVANYVHRRSFDESLSFDREAIEQTLGLGYAVYRDFYISPYVIFEPEYISGERTLVNFKASINL